ncbi:hypothetical protein GGQ73_000638 [Rhizobium skierniewicense]|uniref:DUF4376 domain-containing protein n=1 Tax=Rhizobium skierniewicense TaxID=984260 RepID=A0A7W6C697_9HYPH|nr:hypothetical protein [Rhizobium skierniewicense]MBB3944713.1 hypothetical protein [Rhizobium skierniewicense]
MTIYVKVADGIVTDRAIFDGPVPDDFPDHKSWIAQQDAQIGWSFTDGQFTPPHTPAPDLEEVKRNLKIQIDDDAEAARCQYITPGAGQAMTYQRKVDEAKLAVLENDPQSADYPMLAASLGIDGDAIKDIALLVLAMDAQWAIIGSAIERARQTAKEAVNASETVEAVQIAAQVVWP